jgi:predicted nucleotide-binding protein (sugar kinase/HSP70/actin superfamily)
VKASFSNIGNSWVAFKGFLETLGAEVIIPPKITKNTFILGDKFAPKLCCLSFKIVTGNLIEAVNLGADTLVILSGKPCRCRFACSEVIFNTIFRKLKYKVKIVTLAEKGIWYDIFKVTPKLCYKNSNILSIKAWSLFWWKLKVLDEFEKEKRKIAPYEIKKGEAENIFQEGIKYLDQAKTIKEIKQVRNTILKLFGKILLNNPQKRFRIGIIGENFVVLEPSVNFNIEKELASRGIECYSFVSIYEFFKTVFGLNRVRKRIMKIGSSHLGISAGGYELQYVGEIIKYKNLGFDGFIHLYPFACINETIVRGVYPKVAQQMNLPFLQIALNDFTENNKVLLRLETFIELLKRRKK